MFIVGLTGGIATGKSTVLSMFREKGIAVLNADDVSRKVLAPGTAAWREVKEYFGNKVIYASGEINRTVLGAIAFNNKEKRMKLNAITHPRIYTAMIKMTFKYLLLGHQFIVIEVPLLFETEKLLWFMHKIITVTCTSHQQLDRLVKRNSLSVLISKKRIECQMPLEEKVGKSDFVIDNSGDRSSTREQTESIITILKQSNFTRNDKYELIIIVVLNIPIFVDPSLTNKSRALMKYVPNNKTFLLRLNVGEMLL